MLPLDESQQGARYVCASFNRVMRGNVQGDDQQIKPVYSAGTLSFDLDLWPHRRRWRLHSALLTYTIVITLGFISCRSCVLYSRLWHSVWLGAKWVVEWMRWWRLGDKCGLLGVKYTTRRTTSWTDAGNGYIQLDELLVMSMFSTEVCSPVSSVVVFDRSSRCTKFFCLKHGYDSFASMDRLQRNGCEKTRLMSVYVEGVKMEQTDLWVRSD